MNHEQSPSILVRLLSIGFFLLFALAALAWYIFSMTDLTSAHLSGQSVVSFDKGSTYMLGAGIGGLLFVIGGVMQGLLRKRLTPKAESLFTKGLIFSLILMFVLPHITHYAVATYTQHKNYSVCRDASYRWLLYTKFYYANTDTACKDLAEQKRYRRN